MLKYRSFSFWRGTTMFLWLFTSRKEEKWAVNTKPYCLTACFLCPSIRTNISMSSSSLLGVFLFRSHIFHCSSPKGSQNITWKRVVISPLLLWGSYHNSERPRQACNFQDFASFSCTLSFRKDIWNNILNISRLNTYKKIIFCCWVWGVGREPSERQELEASEA